MWHCVAKTPVWSLKKISQRLADVLYNEENVSKTDSNIEMPSSKKCLNRKFSTWSESCEWNQINKQQYTLFNRIDFFDLEAAKHARKYIGNWFFLFNEALSSNYRLTDWCCWNKLWDYIICPWKHQRAWRDEDLTCSVCIV